MGRSGQQKGTPQIVELSTFSINTSFYLTHSLDIAIDTQRPAVHAGNQVLTIY